MPTEIPGHIDSESWVVRSGILSTVSQREMPSPREPEMPLSSGGAVPTGVSYPMTEPPELEEDNIDDGSEEVAKRYNEGKAKFSLIDPSFEEGVARVLTFGAEKYGEENWKRSAGTENHDSFVRGCYDSMRRHLNALGHGENTDGESGLPHLDHVACNVMFIRYYDLYMDVL